MITIIFGTNNKEDDEEEDTVEYRTVQNTQEPTQGRSEEEASVPSRDSRPQRDYPVSEVDGITHQEVTFSTTPPGSVSGSVWGLEDRPCSIPVYRYFGSTGSG